MNRRPPIRNRTATRFPDATLFRSGGGRRPHRGGGRPCRGGGPALSGGRRRGARHRHARPPRRRRHDYRPGALDGGEPLMADTPLKSSAARLGSLWLSPPTATWIGLGVVTLVLAQVRAIGIAHV